MFARLRTPAPRATSASAPRREQSGFHKLADLRDFASLPAPTLGPATVVDEFAGLDHLDREELDEV